MGAEQLQILYHERNIKEDKKEKKRVPKFRNKNNLYVNYCDNER